MNKKDMLKLINEYQGKVTDLRKHARLFMASIITDYPKNWPLFQKLYHELYLEGSTDAIICPICNITPLTFSGLRLGYRKSCSNKCKVSDPAFFEKYKTTCLARYGTEFASQSPKFRNAVKTTCIEKYGVDNPFKAEEIKLKHRITMQQKYGVTNGSKSKLITDKIKKSRIASGNWIKDEDRTKLEQYRLLVKKITARSYYDHFYKINPSNLGRSRYEYHLDHIFSVEEGFKNNIPAEIIGHWTNLRMLWHLENSKKNTKCHKTKDQLYEDFNQFQNVL